MINKPTHSTIPDFQTIEEEAKFWDTHSFADFLDESKPVDITFIRPPSKGITVRFDNQVLDQIRQHAREKGLGATTLIRMWVLERLRKGTPTASHI